MRTLYSFLLIPLFACGDLVVGEGAPVVSPLEASAITDESINRPIVGSIEYPADPAVAALFDPRSSGSAMVPDARAITENSSQPFTTVDSRHQVHPVFRSGVIGDDGRVSYAVTNYWVGLTAQGDVEWTANYSSGAHIISVFKTAAGFSAIGTLTGGNNFNPGGGYADTRSTHSQAIFVTHREADGSYIDTKIFSAHTGSIAAQKAAVNRHGDLVIGGRLRGSVRFNVSGQEQELVSNGPFVAVLESSGTLKNFMVPTKGLIPDEASVDSVALGDDGAVYAALSYSSTDAKATRLFKWHPQGFQDWFKSDFGVSGSFDRILDLEVSANGDLLVGTGNEWGMSTKRDARLIRISSSGSILNVKEVVRSDDAKWSHKPIHGVPCAVEQIEELANGDLALAISFEGNSLKWSSNIPGPSSSSASKIGVVYQKKDGSHSWFRTLAAKNRALIEGLESNPKNALLVVGAYLGETAWSSAPDQHFEQPESSSPQAYVSFVSTAGSDGNFVGKGSMLPQPSTPVGPSWLEFVPAGPFKLQGGGQMEVISKSCHVVYGGPFDSPAKGIQCSETAGRVHISCTISGTNPGSATITCGSQSGPIAKNGTFSLGKGDELEGNYYSGYVKAPRDLVITSFRQYTGAHDPHKGWYHSSEINSSKQLSSTMLLVNP